MELTAPQQAAIRYSGRNLQLIACAGSGKTEVVARRIAHLLTRPRRPLQPSNVVAFTFTNKAAAELKERVLLRTEEALGQRMPGFAEMYVGTIHGFCQDLLKTEVPKYLKFEPLDAVRQRLYIDRNSRSTGLTTSATLNGRKLKRYVDTDRYSAATAALREDDVSLRRLKACSVANDGLPRYREKLDQDGYLDFSAMLEAAVNELDGSDALREVLSNRIKYVVVDEYQDVNPIQERLIRHLHDLGAGLCVVGDDDQTIYQWRGSSVKNIITFGSRYRNVKQIRLEHNFRSTNGIVETANAFIKRVEDRLPKSMKFGGSQKYQAGDIVALSFDSPEAEADYIVRTMKHIRGLKFDTGSGPRGLAWSDMSILLRSVKNNGAPIAEALTKARIPFIVGGIADLFDTPEAYAARATFHYISDTTIRSSGQPSLPPPKRKKLLSLWQSAKVGIRPKPLKAALAYATGIRNALREGNQTNFPSIQAVYLEFMELAKLREEKVPDGRGETVFFNLGRFSSAITDWESIHFSDRSSSAFEGFTMFLHFSGDGTYSEGMRDAPYAVPDAVQMMTVHQAKGREWPAVFIPALLRNRFPSRNMPSAIWQLLPRDAFGDSARYDGSEDDERRLFYVAMTRSQKILHMTYAPIGSNRLYRRKSIFWDEVIESKWVKRKGQNYASRPHRLPSPRASVADVEFSFSDLKYMFDCPYQFKLRVLCGFNAPIQRALGYGKSLHDALAEVHYRAMRGDFVDEAQVPELVGRHLRTPYAFGDMLDTLETAAHRDIRNYILDNRDTFDQIEFAEKTVEVYLDDGVSVKGRIDLVRRLDTDETKIVDLKSSERSQDEDVSEHQLHTYALGYEELTGRSADYVEIYELRERKPKRRPVDDEFTEDVKERTVAAAEALRKMQFEPTPSRSRCRNCDFARLCSRSAV